MQELNTPQLCWAAILMPCQLTVGFLTFKSKFLLGYELLRNSVKFMKIRYTEHGEL